MILAVYEHVIAAYIYIKFDINCVLIECMQHSIESQIHLPRRI